MIVRLRDGTSRGAQEIRFMATHIVLISAEGTTSWVERALFDKIEAEEPSTAAEPVKCESCRKHQSFLRRLRKLIIKQELLHASPYTRKRLKG